MKTIKKPITARFRRTLKNLRSGYAPSLRVEEGADQNVLKLDSGENAFAPTLQVDWAKIQRELPLYPDSSVLELRQLTAAELSTSSGVSISPDMVVFGNGSDELIDLIGRLFLEPGRTLVDFTPTFPMFAKFAQLSGCRIQNVPRRADFQLDLAASVAALQRADLAFLANPNNPTGTVVPLETIEALLQTGTPLVVDEAYFEFCGLSALPLLQRFENLIVLRTFSKWAGVASVRVGFAVAAPAVIQLLDAIRAPYNVNGVAQEVAKAAWRQKATLLESVEQICAGRDWFVAAVQASPTLSEQWRVVPSQASCVTLIPLSGSVPATVKHLRQQGILVKRLSLPDLPDACRLSAGPVEVMRRVVNSLSQL